MARAAPAAAAPRRLPGRLRRFPAGLPPLLRGRPSPEPSRGAPSVRLPGGPRVGGLPEGEREGAAAVREFCARRGRTQRLTGFE